MEPHRLVVLLVIGSIVAASSPPFALAADSNYELSIAGSIETPTRTISLDGETHTVSSVARTAPGKTLAVTVTAPTEANYHVDIYNKDRQHVASKSGTGDQTVSFNLTGYPPSSYFVVLYKDGDYKAIQPLVVRGYTVAVTAPSRAQPDAEITVSVTLENTGNVESPHAVTVVVANGTQVVRVTAKQSDQTYQATLALDTLPKGEARIYAVVEGDEAAFKENRNELLGISDPVSIAISEPSTQTPTRTTRESSPPSTTVHSQTHTTGATSAQSTSTTTTQTATTRPTTTQTRTPTPASQTPHTTTGMTTTAQTTNANVITPVHATPTTTRTTTEPAIPGFEVRTGIVALLGALYLVARR